MANPTYEQALKAYRIFGDLVLAQGLTPVHAVPITPMIWYLPDLDQKWLTIKEVMESVTKCIFPDIMMVDAIELAKVTPFSAEEWYKGCAKRIV